MSRSACVDVAPGERGDDPVGPSPGRSADTCGEYRGLQRVVDQTRRRRRSTRRRSTRALGRGPPPRAARARPARRAAPRSPPASRSGRRGRHEPGRDPVLEVAGERGDLAGDHGRAGVGRRHQPHVPGARGVVAQRDRVHGGLGRADGRARPRGISGQHPRAPVAVQSGRPARGPTRRRRPSAATRARPPPRRGSPSRTRRGPDESTPVARRPRAASGRRWSAPSRCAARRSCGSAELRGEAALVARRHRLGAGDARGAGQGGRRARLQAS